jgi:hypothetical protein
VFTDGDEPAEDRERARSAAKAMMEAGSNKHFYGFDVK